MWLEDKDIKQISLKDFSATQVLYGYGERFHYLSSL